MLDKIAEAAAVLSVSAVIVQGRCKSSKQHVGAHSPPPCPPSPHPTHAPRWAHCDTKAPGMCQRHLQEQHPAQQATVALHVFSLFSWNGSWCRPLTCARAVLLSTVRASQARLAIHNWTSATVASAFSTALPVLGEHLARCLHWWRSKEFSCPCHCLLTPNADRPVKCESRHKFKRFEPQPAVGGSWDKAWCVPDQV